MNAQEFAETMVAADAVSAEAVEYIYPGKRQVVAELGEILMEEYRFDIGTDEPAHKPLQSRPLSYFRGTMDYLKSCTESIVNGKSGHIFTHEDTRTGQVTYVHFDSNGLVWHVVILP